MAEGARRPAVINGRRCSGASHGWSNESLKKTWLSGIRAPPLGTDRMKAFTARPPIEVAACPKTSSAPQREACGSFRRVRTSASRPSDPFATQRSDVARSETQPRQADHDLLDAVSQVHQGKAIAHCVRRHCMRRRNNGAVGAHAADEILVNQHPGPMQDMKVILGHKRLDGLDDLLDKQHRVRIKHLGIVAPHGAAFQYRLIWISLHSRAFHASGIRATLEFSPPLGNCRDPQTSIIELPGEAEIPIGFVDPFGKLDGPLIPRLASNRIRRTAGDEDDVVAIRQGIV